MNSRTAPLSANPHEGLCRSVGEPGLCPASGAGRSVAAVMGPPRSTSRRAAPLGAPAGPFPTQAGFAPDRSQAARACDVRRRARRSEVRSAAGGEIGGRACRCRARLPTSGRTADLASSTHPSTWYGAWLDLLGSVAFGASAVGAYVAPSTGEYVSAWWDDAG